MGENLFYFDSVLKTVLGAIYRAKRSILLWDGETGSVSVTHSD